ncbi:MAG: hypothetical protein OEQ39_02865 [Gammaproteobacteria bacterium]|nr:hypothetical protein [Gammaproteobacteria bacterium]MDH3375891.1 hypothetical protein [Gammaproteobacteria bacterium]
MDNLPALKGIDDITKLGEIFERSGMFGCSQAGQGTILVMSCLQSGLTPMQFIERYHLIDGRPSMRSDAMLARLLELGGSYSVIERTPEVAGIIVQYKDATYESTLTWDEARLEPFTKDHNGKIKRNWATPRARMQMLWARVVSDAVRTVCPLVCSGTYTPEETMDLAQPSESPPATPPAIKTVEPEFIAEEQSDEPDYSVVPSGRLAGTKMADLTDEQLVHMSKWNKVGPEYRVAAKQELERRISQNEADHNPA